MLKYLICFSLFSCSQSVPTVSAPRPWEKACDDLNPQYGEKFRVRSGFNEGRIGIAKEYSRMVGIVWLDIGQFGCGNLEKVQ